MVKLNKNQSFVIFKNPFENNFNYLTGPFSKIQSYNELKSGYLFAPFDLQKDYAYHIEGDNIKLNSIPEEINGLLNWDLKEGVSVPKSTDFKNIVEKAIIKIRETNFQKLVLSRFEKQELPKSFKIKSYLESIEKAYPECFIYLLYVPNECCWLGASPEILGIANKKGDFETIALAGTMKKERLEKGEEWGEKEIVEQALVTSFILEKIKKFNPKNIQSIGPENANTGDLTHLKTSIKANILKEKTLELILELHPTPAVCGIPKDKAIDYILENENYKREFYSGFSGIVKNEFDYKFYVNLRCMQLSREGAILYAGAGITSDSVAEKEYIETSNKINALKRHLYAAADTL